MLWSPPSCTAVVRHSIAASASSRIGAPVTGPAWCRIASSCPSSGLPRVASQVAVFSASSPSTDIAQVPAASTASWNRAIFSAHIKISSGSRDTAVNAVAVIAWLTPSRLVVATTMPLANLPEARRKAAGSTPLTRLPPAIGETGPAQPPPEADHHPDRGADRPAVEVPLARGGVGDDYAARGGRQGQQERRRHPADRRAHPRSTQQAGGQDQRAEGQRRDRDTAQGAGEVEAPDQPLHEAQQEQRRVGRRGPDLPPLPRLPAFHAEQAIRTTLS